MTHVSILLDEGRTIAEGTKRKAVCVIDDRSVCEMWPGSGECSDCYYRKVVKLDANMWEGEI